ncbi:MAG: hypothetical protein FVQ83_12080 [Chloroflexi bacterium]|nr:hypothetical protein [Chloroflexota bacterium]
MNLIELPYKLPGKVFRSPMPYSYFDREGTTFDEIKNNDINLVVVLTGDEENIKNARLDLRRHYEETGLDVLYFPIVDFSVPGDIAALSAAVDSAIQQAQNGKNIAVHCYAGIGRTGMFLALMARRVLGMGGEEAVEWVRKFVDGAVQTSEQVRVILENAGGPTNDTENNT